jgi:hypothetical protein
MAGQGRGYGAKKRKGRGPGGPPAYPGFAGEVGWTRGHPVAADFGGDDVGTYREMAAMASTPALLSLIRLAGRKRKVWQSFPASQRGRGRRRMPTMDGGRARLWRAVSGERARTR